MQGEIFNIQKFCVNDGPGIRTTVFFKGCPLRCLWCHNPESQIQKKQIMFYPDKCSGCGRCLNLTVDDSEFVCFSGSKEICGKTVSSDYVIDEVMKDYEFYKNSGGGITLSGGEPLFQFEFALDILKKSKENKLHTAIETCGFTDKSKIMLILEYADIFLYDWKITDNSLHKEYTGESNAQIKENLYAIDRAGAKVILRCPIIPGINDNNEHFSGIAEIANSLDNILGIEIEPYHSLGIHKYEKLGKNIENFKESSKDEIEWWVKEIQSKTVLPVKKA